MKDKRGHLYYVSYRKANTVILRSLCVTFRMKLGHMCTMKGTPTCKGFNWRTLRTSSSQSQKNTSTLLKTRLRFVNKRGKKRRKKRLR